MWIIEKDEKFLSYDTKNDILLVVSCGYFIYEFLIHYKVSCLTTFDKYHHFGIICSVISHYFIQGYIL